jgi:alkaline phosphatase D
MAKIYQATGFKVTEPGPHRAIVWTRGTACKERGVLPEDIDKYYSKPDFPKLSARDFCDFAAPGIEGESRVVYGPESSSANPTYTGWRKFRESDDFTRCFELTGLQCDTAYRIQTQVRSKANHPSHILEGRFRTAPHPNTIGPVRFAVLGCQSWEDRDADPYGHAIYYRMLESTLAPHFFIHTGDAVYYDDRDRPYVHSVPEGRVRWQRLYSCPYQRYFHKHVSSFFMKDDHDTFSNDCWHGIDPLDSGFSYAQGRRVFLEQTARFEEPDPAEDIFLPDKSPNPDIRPHYRSVRWGKLAELFLMESRDYRTHGNDAAQPGSSIWGKTQKDWLFNKLETSHATFKIIVNQGPLVGPDRPTKVPFPLHDLGKHDNYANEDWNQEGLEILDFIGRRNTTHNDNIFIICGDRHWQYHSRHQATGVHEFGVGPASDQHAAGLKNSHWPAKEHDGRNWILKPVQKGGACLVTITRPDPSQAPTAEITIVNTEGETKHSVTLTAS